MPDTPENMIIDFDDAPSQPVDRAGKRGLGEREEREPELVSLHSSRRPAADCHLAPPSHQQAQMTLPRSQT